MTLLTHRCFPYSLIFCHRVIHLHFTRINVSRLTAHILFAECRATFFILFSPYKRLPRWSWQVSFQMFLPHWCHLEPAVEGEVSLLPCPSVHVGRRAGGGLGVRRLISLIDCKYSMTGLLMWMYKHGPRHLNSATREAIDPAHRSSLFCIRLSSTAEVLKQF